MHYWICFIIAWIDTWWFHLDSGNDFKTVLRKYNARGQRRLSGSFAFYGVKMHIKMFVLIASISDRSGKRGLSEVWMLYEIFVT